MAGENEVPKGDPKGDPKQEEKKTEATETVESLKAKLAESEAAKHAANEESKKHRLEGKTAKEKADRLEKAWKIAQGDDPDKADPAKLEKEKIDGKMRKLLLKSAFVSEAAAEMHDAEHSFDSVANDLGELEVDLENGKVDKKAIKERVAELKKTRPYLFKTQSDLKEPPKPKGQKEEGTPKDGENPYTKWQNLRKTDVAAGTKFYTENRAAIIANMPK